MYNLIVHPDREHRAALTNATAYIVVFKKSATKEEVEKWKNEIIKASEYLISHMGSNPAYRASAIVIDGQVTHEYGTVLNGFAAKIAPETFSLLTNSVKDDGPIQYIGLCISLDFVWTVTLTGLLRTRWRGHYPIEKMPYPHVISNVPYVKRSLS